LSLGQRLSNDRKRRHDTPYNDTEHDETQENGFYHNDTQPNDTSERHNNEAMLCWMPEAALYT